MTDTVTYLNPPNARALLGLYSHVARVPAGEQAFLAGQVASEAAATPEGARDFAAQFHEVFDSIGRILGDLGTDFNSVAKFTTYLVDAQHLEPFMELRKELFPRLFAGSLYPPNTLLIVDRLVKEEFLIEVEVVARLPG